MSQLLLSRRSTLFALGVSLGGATFAHASRAKGAVIPEFIRPFLRSHQKAPGLSARFEEEKHIAFLDAPIRSKGHVYFARPGLFCREVSAPESSKMVVRDGAIHFRQGKDKPARVTLKGRPELRALVEGFLFLFAGDEKKLEALYSIRSQGSQKAWNLTLTPRKPEMAQLVAKLVVSGGGSSLTGFEVHEKSGDYSVTRLSELQVPRRFSDQEKRRIFAV